MGQFVRHCPCPACGSSDNGAVYDDGTCYCHTCTHWWREDGGEVVQDRGYAKVSSDVSWVRGDYMDIPKRGLYEDTCKKYGYLVNTDRGCHVAQYRDPETRALVAQKIRLPGKEFQIVGEGKGMPLFGQHLFAAGGRSIVVTEGEIDALAFAQAFDCKWPVVSLPNGAQSASKAVKNHFEYLASFDKVVLAFDADAPGRKAAEEVCEILPAGKCHIPTYPDGCKDAGDVLLAHGGAALVKAFWNAKQWRPDGIQAIEDLREEILNPAPDTGVAWPWSTFDLWFKKIQQGKLYTLTSGSGLGKSTLARVLLYHLALVHGLPCGGMFLEESNRETTEILMALYLRKNFPAEEVEITSVERTTAFDEVAKAPIHLWDHFGSNGIDSVLTKMMYMVRVLGIKYLFLDHVSILVSGEADQGDERKTIDAIMTKLRTFCESTGATIFLVSHLKRPSGDKGHEDGAPVNLGQLRGSAAIGQLSDVAIGLQKPSDDPTGNEIEIVSLKNRPKGKRGFVMSLFYDPLTAWFNESIFDTEVNMETPAI